LVAGVGQAGLAERPPNPCPNPRIALDVFGARRDGSRISQIRA
jgi:hypothetical protein